MSRNTGRFETVAVAGERVQAFVPHPLPPTRPKLKLSGRLTDALQAAEHSLSRLDAAGRMVPSLDLVRVLVRAEGSGRQLADRGYTGVVDGSPHRRGGGSDQGSAGGRRGDLQLPRRPALRPGSAPAPPRASPFRSAPPRDAPPTPDGRSREGAKTRRNPALSELDRRHAPRQCVVRSSAAPPGCGASGRSRTVPARRRQPPPPGPHRPRPRAVRNDPSLP